MTTGVDRGGRAIWLLGLGAIGVIGVSVLMVRANPYTTVRGNGAGWVWSAVGASALILAATVARTGRRRVAIGIAGLWWFVPEWAGWSDGPASIRIAASATGAMLVIAVVFAAFEVVGVAGRIRAALLWPMFAAASVIFVVRLGFEDPFTDRECWRHCGRNPMLVADVPRSEGIVDVATAVIVLGSAVAAACVIVVAVRSIRRGSLKRARSDATLVTAVGAATMIGGVAAFGSRPTAGSLVVAAGGAVVMALGLLLGRWREWRMKVALRHLVEQLRGAPAPGALAGALAVNLQDPELQVLYCTADRDGHVAADGLPASLPTPGERAVTAVVRGGVPVADIVHRRGLDTAAVERALGPAMRLWLNNEQLQALALAELAELRASEARLAQRQDEERRRLERNLHDGAQQRVVGIALLLRMLDTRHGDMAPPATMLIDRSIALLDALLDDLREVATESTRPRHLAAPAPEPV